MSNKCLKQILQNALSKKNENTFRQDVYYLARKVFSLSQVDLILKENQIFDDTIFNSCLERYLNDEPLYYILKEAPFMSFMFYVNSDVLIPRNETEEMVVRVNEDIKKDHFENIKVLDACCGSGCIGIAISLLNKDVSVTGIDISLKALEVAKKNNHKLNAKVTFYQSDCLEQLIKRKEKYHYVVSNPPYIDKDTIIDKSVYDFEPHLALFADHKGMAIIEKIISQLDQVLLIEGRAYIEISPEQKDELEKLLNNHYSNYQYEFKKDINELTRFLFLKRIK